MAELVKWSVVTLYAASALLTISTIGKPKKPVTASVAVMTVLIDAALIVGIIHYWH